MKIFSYLPFLFLMVFTLESRAQHPPVFDGMKTDSTSIVLGDLNVNLVKYSYSQPNINFLTIHDNEDTGVKAAFRFLNEIGGTIIDCQYGGVRNFKFTYEDEIYQTDPNSIYTKRGIRLGQVKRSLIPITQKQPAIYLLYTTMPTADLESAVICPGMNWRVLRILYISTLRWIMTICFW